MSVNQIKQTEGKIPVIAPSNQRRNEAKYLGNIPSYPGAGEINPSRMSFGWLRPNGLSQPKDIQASAINHHKAICPILIPIVKLSGE